MSLVFRASFSEPKFRFLSNFWNFEKPLVYQGMSFKTSEAFYMAMKTKDVHIRKSISLASSGAEAKKIGRAIDLRGDWEDIKYDVMLYKFSLSNPNLRSKLLQTGATYLQEANLWGDKIWGVCMKTGEGYNNLGKLLMQVREEINDNQH